MTVRSLDARMDATAPRQAGFGGLAGAPHLVATAIAILAVGAALWIGELRAVALEQTYAHRVAPQLLHQKDRGIALQRAAFAQADLLPIYGSSELQTINNPYHASNWFREYPTGFTVFPVGDIGSTTLIMVESLAAMGDAARGRRVVFSLSPYWFFQVKDYSAEYAGNFSALQAGELLFSSRLSLDLKQQVARRMLRFPATLEHRPILKLAAVGLSQGSVPGRMLYVIVWPLGGLSNWVLRLQDHWESVGIIRHEPSDSASLRRALPIDWPSVLANAQRDFAAHNDNNPFGFDNHWYQHKFKRSAAKNTITEASFRAGLSGSEEWTDLGLLLRVAGELGARSLVICAPCPGLYYDSLGIPEDLRQEYYRRFEETVRSHAVPVIDFADHDRDRYFVLDPGTHPSEMGWAYYDRALDAFFHEGSGQ